jgi:drug/metabolite transporter (DMT)-like permease
MADTLTSHGAPRGSPAQRRGLTDARLSAIALICAATSLFAFLDTSSKYLSTVAHLPVPELVWTRFVTAALVTFAILGPGGATRAARSGKTWLQLLRSTFLLGSTAFNFVALQYLQLDQTSTIFFLAPLIVAALAGPMLNEWVGWRRLIAICVGFTGVLFITQPGFHWAMSLSFLSTLSYALYSLLTRYLARYDNVRTTLFYTPIAGSIFFAPLAISVWQTPPSALIWLLLLSTGLLGGFSHWLLILALERAPAPVLAPFGYFNIVFMVLLGYLVFADVPGWWTLAGAGIIIISGLYLLIRERQKLGSDGPASSATVAEG